MKKVEVISFDIGNDFNYPNIAEKTIEWWFETEEAKFIKQHSQTLIQIRVMNDPSTSIKRVKLWATLEEKYETFWRLKYK